MFCKCNNLQFKEVGTYTAYDKKYKLALNWEEKIATIKLVLKRVPN